MANSKPLSLKELNPRSAGLGAFDIITFHSRIDKYEFADKKTRGKMKQGATFRTMLVSTDDPTLYLTAELAMRSDNIKPLEEALKKFKVALRFRMTSVRLKSGQQQSYMHTSLKMVVDLLNTKFDAILQSSTTVTTAEPNLSVAHCKLLNNIQRFDITGLVLDYSEPRNGGENREIRDVSIIDGTKALDTGKIVEMKISIWSDEASSTAKLQLQQLLTEVAGTDRAVSLFAVQCRNGRDGPEFSSSKEFFALEATGTKAQQLKTKQPALSQMAPEMRETITSFSATKKDYSQESGIQVFVTHINDMQRPNEFIEGKELTFNVNWVEVSTPDPNLDSITTKDGSRLWFPATIRDLTGVSSSIQVTEPAALALAGLTNKETFIEKWKNDALFFPIAAAVKIGRSTKNQSDASDDSQNQTFVNYIMHEACDQPLEMAPTEATLPLVAMMKGGAHDTASIVPAALNQINSSPIYAFELTYNDGAKPMVIPCQKVLALIRSNQESKVENCGSGFKIVTTGIQCELDDDPQHADKKYNVSAVCTTADMLKYRLDPPKNKTRYALITITNKTDDNFVIESVHPLEEDEAKVAKRSLRSIMTLAQKIACRDKKHPVEWSKEESPHKCRKCAVLGKSPTDSGLDQYTSTPTA